MEKSHLSRLQSKFGEALDGKQVICLHIPDEYEYNEPNLIDDLRATLSAYVKLPGEP